MKIKNSWLITVFSIMLIGAFHGDGIAALEDANRPVPKTDDRISMDFENAGLQSVLKAFSVQTGINFIASDAIENKKVTVFLNDVSMKLALDSVLEANGLLYEKLSENLYLIVPSGKGPMRTVTRIFKLNYLSVSVVAPSGGPSSGASNITIIGAGSAIAPSAPASGGGGVTSSNIISVVQSLMTQYGRIVADTRNNSLVITDLPSVFPAIEAALKKLDVEPIQIMITAEIIETSTSALKRIGLEYGTDEGVIADVTYTGPNLPSPLPFAQSFIKNTYGKTLLGAGSDFTYGTLTLGDTQMVLKLLATDTDTKYLSRPRIMTLNNETAIIRVSANTAIGINQTTVASSESETLTAERAETGVILRVTPQVNDGGDIFMLLEPSVSRAVVSTLSENFYDPSYRSSTCTMMVRDLETVVVSGLIQKNITKTVRKVPLLGDIPYLGEAFKSSYDKVEDTEVVIFVTPHIVRKRDAEYVTKKNMTDREYVMQNTLAKHAPGAQEKPLNPKEREGVITRALRNYSAKRSNAPQKTGQGK